MKARPILFSGPMVRALLDGKKTQTRRIAKLAPRARDVFQDDDSGLWMQWWDEGQEPCGAPTREVIRPLPCRYGKPGDLLWVRETWACYRQTSYEYDEWEQVFSAEEREELAGCLSPVYQADNKNYPDRWNPSIHMTRWASRLTLEITGVRVERLQDICEADAIDEGMEVFGIGWRAWEGQPLVLHARHAYQDCWKAINGSDSWSTNPWVWVIEFQAQRNNVDHVLRTKGPNTKEGI